VVYSKSKKRKGLDEGIPVEYRQNGVRIRILHRELPLGVYPRILSPTSIRLVPPHKEKAPHKSTLCLTSLFGCQTRLASLSLSLSLLALSSLFHLSPLPRTPRAMRRAPEVVRVASPPAGADFEHNTCFTTDFLMIQNNPASLTSLPASPSRCDSLSSRCATKERIARPAAGAAPGRVSALVSDSEQNTSPCSTSDRTCFLEVSLATFPSCHLSPPGEFLFSCPCALSEFGLSLRPSFLPYISVVERAVKPRRDLPRRKILGFYRHLFDPPRSTRLHIRTIRAVGLPLSLSYPHPTQTRNGHTSARRQPAAGSKFWQLGGAGKQNRAVHDCVSCVYYLYIHSVNGVYSSCGTVLAAGADFWALLV
jgi:hypothetical protein